jgi:hypothetical protein
MRLAMNGIVKRAETVEKAIAEILAGLFRYRFSNIMSLLNWRNTY